MNQHWCIVIHKSPHQIQVSLVSTVNFIFQDPIKVSHHKCHSSTDLESFSDFLFLKNIFYWLCYCSCPICPLYSPSSHSILLTSIPLTLTSSPWVIHRSSLASAFTILFLTFSCLFCTYHLYFLFSVPFPPLSPSPVDNLPCDLHFCGSIPVLVVCLVCFCFRLGC